MPRARDFAPTLTGLHVVVYGNPVDGWTVYGPFKTGDDAHRFIARHDDAGMWALPLAAPEEAGA